MRDIISALLVVTGLATASGIRPAHPRYYPRRHINATSFADEKTTLTVFVSSVYTVTSCAASITNCPGRKGTEPGVDEVTVTDTIMLLTTICPVTAADAISAGIVSSFASSVASSTSVHSFLLSAASSASSASAAFSSSLAAFTGARNATAAFVATITTSAISDSALPTDAPAGLIIFPSGYSSVTPTNANETAVVSSSTANIPNAANATGSEAALASTSSPLSSSFASFMNSTDPIAAATGSSGPTNGGTPPFTALATTSDRVLTYTIGVGSMQSTVTTTIMQTVTYVHYVTQTLTDATGGLLTTTFPSPDTPDITTASFLSTNGVQSAAGAQYTTVSDVTTMVEYVTMTLTQSNGDVIKTMSASTYTSVVPVSTYTHEITSTMVQYVTITLTRSNGAIDYSTAASTYISILAAQPSPDLEDVSTIRKTGTITRTETLRRVKTATMTIKTASSTATGEVSAFGSSASDTGSSSSSSGSTDTTNSDPGTSSGSDSGTGSNSNDKCPAPVTVTVTQSVYYSAMGAATGIICPEASTCVPITTAAALEGAAGLLSAASGPSASATASTSISTSPSPSASAPTPPFVMGNSTALVANGTANGTAAVSGFARLRRGW